MERGNSPTGKRDAFYARSWLLYHYLTFNKDRDGQRNAYLQSIISGTSSIEAAQAAFGDLEILERELLGYSRQRRFFTYSLTPEALPIGNITLTKLSEGEAQIMKVRMRSQRGVDEEIAADLVVEARKIAAQFPTDAGVQTALAEAEYDARNLDAAIAAADKAISTDPNRINAYVQKGYALFRKAKNTETADEKRAAYTLAMGPFSALNTIENDHPLPLIYYYRSFAERGVSPPENARHALERAAQLAPFDQSLWMQVAAMQIREGKIELAKLSLQPVAASPHGSNMSAKAKEILDGLNAISIKIEPEGDPVQKEKASDN